MLIAFLCAHCGATSAKEKSHVNRSRSIGAPLYCGRECSGLGRRKGKTKAQKIEEKRQYDAEYRASNAAILKAKKAAHYQRTRDPVKEAEARKARMPLHVEYCRRPEYRAKKHEYDKRRYHERAFGDFAEVSTLLQDLEREIESRATKYEIYLANGRFDKTRERKRGHGIIGR